MQPPKKLAVSISIGVLLLIGVFAVIALTPSGLFTGAMRNMKKTLTKSSIPWWCITEEEANKKWQDYWCSMDTPPEWTKEICKDYKKGSSTPGGQTISPGAIKFFQSGKYPIDPNFQKWAKMYVPKNSGNSIIVGNVPQPDTPSTDTTPPEDGNNGSADSSTETTPPEVHQTDPEYSDEQYCKDVAAGNVGPVCDCGQTAKFIPECNTTITCKYFQPDSVCDPKWQCSTGYVQDNNGVDEKCMNEILHVKQLQCAGKEAAVNADVKKVCEAFDDDYMFEWLNKPCVEKDQCEHLKKLFDEGIETNEALTQLGMSSSEYDSCTALFNKEWSGEKAW